jgi:hypothetical protein
MAKVITTIAAENGMDYDDILSFETKNYVGLWNYDADTFTIIEKSTTEFYPRNLEYCETLQELDDMVFAKVNEHILEVFGNSSYAIRLAGLR